VAKKPGSNTLSPDEKADLIREYRKQKRECESANGVLRNLLKRAKAAGMETKEMIAAVAATKIDPEEVVASLRTRIEYMGILRIDIPRDSLFDGIDIDVTAKTVHADDLWTAEDKGYRAGRNGVPIDDNPYHQANQSELFAAWARDWAKGQASIAHEMGPQTKAASADRSRPARAEGQPGLGIVPDAPKKARKPGKRAPGYVPGAGRKRRGAGSSALN
jgi:ribosome modulation factor